MNTFWISIAIGLLIVSSFFYKFYRSTFKIDSISHSNLSKAKSIYSYRAKNLLDGKAVSFENYRGKVLMIVNTASKCGLTPQYADLQKLHNMYSSKNFEIVGFPSNDFFNQELGSSDEIQGFCEKNYGVSFQLFEKAKVKKKPRHPVYEFLTNKEINGVKNSKVRWNFQKYLLDDQGRIRMVIYPRISVLDQRVINRIEQLIAE